MFIRKKRYEEILEVFFNAGEKSGEQKGLVRGYKQGYLMGQIEKTNRSAEDDFVDRLHEQTIEMHKRAAILKNFSVLKEAQDIVDQSGF